MAGMNGGLTRSKLALAAPKRLRGGGVRGAPFATVNHGRGTRQPCGCGKGMRSLDGRPCWDCRRVRVEE